MTKDEFKYQFKRLCTGFKFEPTSGQVEAFFERLHLYDARDWREAVTDLLCAPRFPKDLTVIVEVVGKRADERRRADAERARMQPVQIAETAQDGFVDMPADVREHLKKLGVWH